MRRYKPAWSREPGLSLRHDEMGLLQCLYMERGGGQGMSRIEAISCRGARGISQHIQDFQTKRRRGALPIFVIDS